MRGRLIVSSIVAIGLAGAVGLSVANRVMSPQRAAAKAATPQPDFDAMLARIDNKPPMVRPRDAFEVIDPPRYLRPDEAADAMSDDEVVLGLEVNGLCRAYPINYLNDHEMVREQIAGLPLQITW
jgi:hypothetical protein